MAEQIRSDDDIVARPLPHPWRWVFAILILALIGSFVWSLISSPNIQHDVIVQYLFDPSILNGMWLTLFITAVSMIMATIMATVLAIMKLSENPLQRWMATGFIEFFRGTPLLLQIVFWGYLGLIYKTITFGVPFTSITFFSGKTADLMPAVVAGIIALTLNEAAYAAEIVRAGILSVDKGQIEAAKSLGMGSGYTMRKIVLPQAMRVIIPPMGNETISMLKSTSLLEVIAVVELYTAASYISAQNLAQVELLVVAGFWYLVLNTILGFPQRALERRYGRGFESLGVPSRAKRLTGIGRRREL